MNEASTGNNESDVNKSVLKAASLLRALATQPRTGANSSVLARATGLSRPTAIRLLSTLEQAGLVDRFGNDYVLGWDLARMARLVDPYSGLAERTQPILQELAGAVNEMATLEVVNMRDGLDLIAEAMGSHLVNMRSQLAEGDIAQWPLHAGAAGKVLLAHMPREKVVSLLPSKLPSYASRTITDRDVLLQELARIKEQDYALADNELEEELAAVARPIYDQAGTFVAVLTISGPRYRFSLSRIHEVLEHMDATRKLLVSTCWPDGAAG
ncbi:IclR family transcriptional regulator [Arthrobacter sp. NPDC056727]|uniref:IclR family transcriptional regulator n=1 Tax=Arthrobacter sp. NPDC056727 TaxID=3345927 RepID=UPI00366C3D09